MNLNHLSEIQDLIARGAIFYVSTSGGKDSQAMTILLERLVPASQISYIHADLGRVEWDGVQDHIRQYLSGELNVVRAIWRDGRAKSFLDMVQYKFETRPEVPSWPGLKYRQCTADLKRTPIHKFIKADLKARGKSLAVNCMGIRSAESDRRSNMVPFRYLKTLEQAGREVYEWLPLFDLNCRTDKKFDPATMDDDVFNIIAEAGQDPHPAYAAGNDRLSCVFCVYGSPADLANGARQRPELYAEYLALEQSTGYTMFHGESLAEKVARGERELDPLAIAIL